MVIFLFMKIDDQIWHTFFFRSIPTDHNNFTVFLVTEQLLCLLLTFLSFAVVAVFFEAIFSENLRAQTLKLNYNGISAFLDNHEFCIQKLVVTLVSGNGQLFTETCGRCTIRKKEQKGSKIKYSLETLHTSKCDQTEPESLLQQTFLFQNKLFSNIVSIKFKANRQNDVVHIFSCCV